MHAAPEPLSAATARRWLALILLASVLGHFYRIGAPPSGFHTWRECDTAAVSEAFLRETSNLFEPRTHQRGATSGVTGMEFPIYNYAVAQLWRLAGQHHWVPRALSLALGTVGLVGVYALGGLLLGRRAALAAAFFAACSPLYFFYSRKIQPDVLLPAATTWALYLFLRGEARGSRRDFAGALALVTLAAMVKPTALAVGVPILAWTLGRASGARPLSRLRPRHVLFAVVALGAPIAWFAYARLLADRSGLHAFYLGGDLLALWRRTHWDLFVSKGLISWPLELGLGLPAVAAIAGGLLVRRRFDPRLAPALWWLLGCLGAFLLVSEAVTNYHDYYGLIAVPPFALLTASALESLADSPRRVARAFAVIVLVAAPLVTWGRIHQRYGTATEREFVALRAVVDACVPRAARITAEDETPAIALYRLGRPGWTFAPGDPDARLLEQHAAGASHAVFFRRVPSDSLAARLEVVHRDSQLTIARFRDR